MKRVVRATRIVAWVSALALLSYALTAGPIMLRMAAAHAGPQTEQTAVAPCPLHGGQHQDRSGQSPFGDHQHCLFCQGGVGPAVDVALAPWVAPAFEAAPFITATDSPSAVRHLDPGYASRAPPRLT